MKIQINSIPNSSCVDIIYNQIPARYNHLTIDKKDVRTIGISYDNETGISICVEIVFSSGEITVLNWQYIESIDGDVNITSNEILHAKLRAIKIAP